MDEEEGLDDGDDDDEDDDDDEEDEGVVVRSNVVGSSVEVANGKCRDVGPNAAEAEASNCARKKVLTSAENLRRAKIEGLI
ncbi:hypothetical protein Syun_029220 [Stephania yunnanensis]|uniref:Uncharacterized protein n=1 Tax=Stephania yunnanensis TaxID=152371 RepID=A0AAP0E583_9MAGN